MREKMIEILRGVVRFNEEKKEKWILGGKVGERPSIIESFVDILIANDTIPVVRCKDCKHYYDHGVNREYCCHRSKDGKQVFAVKFKADDYCSYGERKNNG